MNLLRILLKWWKKFVTFGQNILAPENVKVQKLLDIDPRTMRQLLPKSVVNIKDILVLFDYGNKIVRLIIKAIKYKNNANLRKRIAGYFYEEIIEISSDIALFEGAVPLLLPMPMSKNEQRKKGFNQCAELVKEIEKLNPPVDGIAVSYNALKKIRETKRQTTLSREERLVNVKNSMEADSKIVKDKVVIVLDDVYTTLASFSEARHALLKAGVRRVIGIFIAH